jgi:hypothetical protein
MAYIANDPASYDGQVVGDGQCVAFVRASSGAPQTTAWQPGVAVRGANVASGTAIATFVNGSYPSASTGNHAAIYVGQDATGIQVWDQWLGQPVHMRTIRFKGGVGSPSNDGDAFSIIQ